MSRSNAAGTLISSAKCLESFLKLAHDDFDFVLDFFSHPISKVATDLLWKGNLEKTKIRKIHWAEELLLGQLARVATAIWRRIRLGTAQSCTLPQQK